MEIRYFQIIVPLVALVFIYFQYNEYTNNRSRIVEALMVVLFWIGLAIFAIFPDFFSGLIAHVFGIKSNINAILFLSIGILAYFQLQLYKKIMRQDHIITELVRKIALDKRKQK